MMKTSIFLILTLITARVRAEEDHHRERRGTLSPQAKAINAAGGVQFPTFPTPQPPTQGPTPPKVQAAGKGAGPAGGTASAGAGTFKGTCAYVKDITPLLKVMNTLAGSIAPLTSEIKLLKAEVWNLKQSVDQTKLCACHAKPAKKYLTTPATTPDTTTKGPQPTTVTTPKATRPPPTTPAATAPPRVPNSALCAVLKDLDKYTRYRSGYNIVRWIGQGKLPTVCHNNQIKSLLPISKLTIGSVYSHGHGSKNSHHSSKGKNKSSGHGSHNHRHSKKPSSHEVRDCDKLLKKYSTIARQFAAAPNQNSFAQMLTWISQGRIPRVNAAGAVTGFADLKRMGSYNPGCN